MARHAAAADARQFRLRRAAGRAPRPALCLALLLHGRGVERAISCTRTLTSRANGTRGRRPRSASGRSRRARRRGAAPCAEPRSLAPWRVRAASSGRRRVPTPSPNAASPPRTCRRSKRCAPRPSSAAAEVAQRLRHLAASLELDELVINTWAFRPEVQRRSYALLAREFGPGGAGPDESDRPFALRGEFITPRCLVEGHWLWPAAAGPPRRWVAEGRVQVDGRNCARPARSARAGGGVAGGAMRRGRPAATTDPQNL